jgi:hypothetical protein
VQSGSDERDRWEKIAAQLDEPAPTSDEKVDEVGTALGTSPQNESSQPPVSDWLVDSRGGTRTHDPGIMRGGAQRGKIALPLRARNSEARKGRKRHEYGCSLGCSLEQAVERAKAEDARREG